MNELLERLEEQKEKLPVEDHLIIDWGINLVKAKMQEEEWMMATNNPKEEITLNDIFKCYKTFINYLEWTSLNLNYPDDRKKITDTKTKELILKIVKSAYQASNGSKNDYIQYYGGRFKRYTRCFFVKQKHEDLFQQFLEICAKFCKDNASNCEQNGSNSQYNPVLASFFRDFMNLIQPSDK